LIMNVQVETPEDLDIDDGELRLALRGNPVARFVAARGIAIPFLVLFITLSVWSGIPLQDEPDQHS